MNYADLYAAGTYTNTKHGVSVFAGTVDDPFFIDLGSAFDTGNFHIGPSGIPGVMNAAGQAPGTSTGGANGNFVADTVSGYAVNVLALQVPIKYVTSTGIVEPPTSPNATIGIGASTSRPQITIRQDGKPKRSVPADSAPSAMQ
jgi:hypothetical protein